MELPRRHEHDERPGARAGRHGPGQKPEDRVEECGDLLFSSNAPMFRTNLLLSRHITSRTYSFYYPKTRPGTDRSLIVASSFSVKCSPAVGAATAPSLRAYTVW